MAEKIALLFPGQGSQSPGMGKSLYEKFPEAKETLDQTESVLGFDLKAKMFGGTEEELRQTDVTQPAIFAVSAAAYRVLSSRIPGLEARAAFAAGHSLGEYSALFAAGAFDFQTGLKLVKYRGLFIHEASQKNPGTMAAVLGILKEDLGKLCEESKGPGEVCTMVNFNCPGQIVVAGTRKAIETLVAKASGIAGAKAIPLSVSGAFHSSLVSEAAVRMKDVLSQAQVRDTRIQVLANCDAQPTTSAADIRSKLVTQIDHAVLWEDSIRRMIDSGVETFVEIGPGRVLSGLMRKIDRKKKVLNIEDEDSLNKAVQELAPAGSAA
jgi:[acyl-carrier-protein] S-malonyltransferase